MTCVTLVPAGRLMVIPTFSLLACSSLRKRRDDGFADVVVTDELPAQTKQVDLGHNCSRDWCNSLDPHSNFYKGDHMHCKTAWQATAVRGKGYSMHKISMHSMQRLSL